MTPGLNDGGGGPSRLRLDLNLATLWSAPANSAGPVGLSEGRQFEAIRAAGYEGVQSILPLDPAALRAARLVATGVARLLTADDLAATAETHQAAGWQATTLILGTGLEDDQQVRRLAEAVLETTARFGYPLLLETHRGTMTQDIRRIVDLVAEMPQLRFTGDLSHWYTGHEMAFGDFEAKLAFIDPVLTRVRFIHGRIGDAGAIQVPLAGRRDEPFVGHFQRMWRRCFEGFLAEAGPGDIMVFAPELLPAQARIGAQTFQLNYARMVQTDGGPWREESDRWLDALELCALAQDAFADARRSRRFSA